MAPRLANELILDILELAFYSPPKQHGDDPRIPNCPLYRHFGDPDGKGLKATSLVCQQWSTYSQTILFRKVELSTRQQILSFGQALRTELSLGEAVRVLHIHLKSGKGDTSREPENTTDHESHLADEIAFILSSCSRLYELRLSVVELPSFSTPAFEHLRQNPPPVVLFDVQKKSEIPTSSSWEIVGQLLESLSTVRYLYINGDTPSPHYKTLDPRFQLSSMEWNSWIAPEVGIMELFLKASVGSLQSLTFRFPPKIDSFQALMATHGASLVNLSLWPAHPAIMELIASAITFQPGDSETPRRSLLPRLQSFHILSIPAANLLDALPTTITSFHFSTSYLTPPSSILPVLRWIAAHPSLQKVAYRFSGGPGPEVKQLEDLCQEKNINLELTERW